METRWNCEQGYLEQTEPVLIETDTEHATHPQEMFRQGDRERAAEYELSPLMDRRKAGITKSQVWLGFGWDLVGVR